MKLNLVKQAFPDIVITTRGNMVKIRGDKSQTQDVKRKMEAILAAVRDHGNISVNAVKEIVSGDDPFRYKTDAKNPANIILYGRDSRQIKARTVNQKKLVELSEENDLVFAIGPAGTGKTYTAVALAVRAFKNKLVQKIILTRPAVEAGENLGFLPGDMKDKVDPYLRPLYDALDDMIPPQKMEFLMTNRAIEVAPLAFMRGRTLDNAFIILDEAQNATQSQLKMFLTRLGPSARCIITGDLTQIDLPRKSQSGLSRTLTVLEGVDGIASLFLNENDVVRHRLVKAIIKAFNRADEAESIEKNSKNDHSS